MFYKTEPNRKLYFTKTARGQKDEEQIFEWRQKALIYKTKYTFTNLDSKETQSCSLNESREINQSADQLMKDNKKNNRKKKLLDTAIIHGSTESIGLVHFWFKLA